jgi:hypothetical protein
MGRAFFSLIYTLYFKYSNLRGGNWTFSEIYFAYAGNDLGGMGPVLPLDKISWFSGACAYSDATRQADAS